MIYSKNGNVFCKTLTITLSQEMTVKIKSISLTSSKQQLHKKNEWDGGMHQQTTCIKNSLCRFKCYSQDAFRTEVSGHSVTSQSRQYLTADDLLKEELDVNCCKALQWNSFEVTVCIFWCKGLKVT